MDKGQFISIVEREQGALRRFLLALCCGNRDDADDIAQDTFLRAYLSLKDYDEKGRAALWLRTIAYNLFLNHRKSQSRHHLCDIENAVNESSEIMADDAYKYQVLYAALNLLSEVERTALVLYYIEGYKINEIAQITASSESAVKKRLERGREELKNKIRL